MNSCSFSAGSRPHHIHIEEKTSMPNQTVGDLQLASPITTKSLHQCCGFLVLNRNHPFFIFDITGLHTARFPELSCPSPIQCFAMSAGQNSWTISSGVGLCMVMDTIRCHIAPQYLGTEHSNQICPVCGQRTVFCLHANLQQCSCWSYDGIKFAQTIRSMK